MWAMNNPEQLKEASILWMHLDEASFLISTAREKEQKKYNLSSVQMKVLLILNYLDKSLTVNELGRWLARGHTSVSLLTDKMKSKGLVEKHPDSANKNQTLVSITRKGKLTLLKLSPRKPIPEVFSTLSEDECAQLKSILEKVIHQAIKVTSPENPPNLDELSRMLMADIK
jgi:DNA-binding MarR family transcriptional regulator